MKTAIAYFTRSGNTKIAAEKLKSKLEEHNINADLIEIKPQKKLGFLRAGRAGMKQDPLPITNATFDLHDYEAIIVGVPVWAGKPAPYYKSFFDHAQHFEGKKAGVFVTQGGDNLDTTVDEAIQQYLSEHKLKTADFCLRLQMRKGKINCGEDHIETFLTRIFKEEKEEEEN